MAAACAAGAQAFVAPRSVSFDPSYVEVGGGQSLDRIRACSTLE